MKHEFDRREYWERKILPWEEARYGGVAWLRPRSWTLRSRLRRAAAVARSLLPEGGSLLELGCGSGLLALRLEGHFGSYHGVDFAGPAIESAQRRVAGANVTFERGDVLDAALPRADLAVFLGLLDWLEPSEAAALIARVPARRLLFSFTERGAGAAPASPYGLYRAWYDRRFGAGVYRARSYSREEIFSWVRALAPSRVEILPSAALDPGRLVIVEREAAR